MGQTSIEQVYHMIREKIIQLELPPGAVLSEANLAEELGVESTAVRGALERLAGDHLVTIHPQQGPYVSKLSLTEQQEIAELRVELEALSARLAAQRIKPEQLAALRAIAARLAGVSPDDIETLMRVDREFHVMLAEAAGNNTLAGILADLYDKSSRFWRSAASRLSFLAGAVERHEELLDALEYGNVEAADRVMREHILEFHRRLRDAF